MKGGGCRRASVGVKDEENGESVKAWCGLRQNISGGRHAGMYRSSAAGMKQEKAAEEKASEKKAACHERKDKHVPQLEDRHGPHGEEQRLKGGGESGGAERLRGDEATRAEIARAANSGGWAEAGFWRLVGSAAVWRPSWPRREDEKRQRRRK